ncbi:CHAP domain-containing protein [Glutamicibacter soli]|uniref:CHAP domain-containing protein n=1 Tax=Glutamicibacter soli TaxID=453836 RepID=UPI003FD67DC6
MKTIEGDNAVFTEGGTGGQSDGSDCAGGGMAGTSPVSNTGGTLSWDGDYPYRDPQGDCSWCAGSQDPGADPWGLYKRECVSFVAWRVNQLMGWEPGQPYPFTMAKMGMAGQGSAKYWGHSLKRKGYKVDMAPTVGAVAWQDAWESNQYYSVYGMGHVAIVKSIDGDMVTLKQYYGSTVLGQSERSRYSTMTLHKDAVSGYIHIADVQTDGQQTLAGGKDADDEEKDTKNADKADGAEAAGLLRTPREQG